MIGCSFSQRANEIQAISISEASLKQPYQLYLVSVSSTRRMILLAYHLMIFCFRLFCICAEYERSMRSTHTD